MYVGMIIEGCNAGDMWNCKHFSTLMFVNPHVQNLCNHSVAGCLLLYWQGADTDRFRTGMMRIESKEVRMNMQQ